MTSTKRPLLAIICSHRSQSLIQNFGAAFDAEWTPASSQDSIANSMGVNWLPTDIGELSRNLASWYFQHNRDRTPLACIAMVEHESKTIAVFHNNDVTAQIQLSDCETNWTKEVTALASLIDDVTTFPSDQFTAIQIASDRDLQSVLAGETNATVKNDTNLRTSPTLMPGVLMPGAFNPIHNGHLEMAVAAEKILEESVELELSVSNVDKPTLDHITFQQRFSKIPSELPVWLTSAPTFVEKASIFPNCTFVVGADTAVRIGQQRYYTDTQARDAAIAAIAAAGCQFLVFGRRTKQRFETLDELDLPNALRKICRGVSQQQFRVDISSTELRSQKNQ